MNALNGYQQLRCDWVEDEGFARLSIGAIGTLLFLRLMADRSKFEARIRGAITCETGHWTAEDAILAVAAREAEAQEHSDSEALELAGKWVYDLREAGMLRFGSEKAVLIVEAYNRDCSGTRRDKSRFLARVEGGGTLDPSGETPGRGAVVAFAGGTWDEAHGMHGSRPRGFQSGTAPAGAGRSLSPPLGAEDGIGGSSPMGGKGGLYPGLTESKQSPNQQTKVQTPNPNQSGRRADAMGGEDNERPAPGDFHARIWNADIVTACEFACQQRGIAFRRTVLARVKQYGEQIVREAAEYVANQFRDCPHTITAKDEQDRTIGGPMMWGKIAEIAEARRACAALGKVGFAT
jgi:hypothetical protein